MDKIFLGVTGCCLLLAGAADAQLDVQFNAGTPVYAAPAYVAPPPPPAAVYVSPYPAYHDPWHRRHDVEYWERYRHDHHEYRR